MYIRFRKTQYRESTTERCPILYTLLVLRASLEREIVSFDVEGVGRKPLAGAGMSQKKSNLSPISDLAPGICDSAYKKSKTKPPIFGMARMSGSVRTK